VTLLNERRTSSNIDYEELKVNVVPKNENFQLCTIQSQLIKYVHLPPHLDITGKFSEHVRNSFILSILPHILIDTSEKALFKKRERSSKQEI